MQQHWLAKDTVFNKRTTSIAAFEISMEEFLWVTDPPQQYLSEMLFVELKSVAGTCRDL